VGEAVRRPENLGPGLEFLPWALGASLFAHAATALAVSYFDQSFVFLYAAFAAIVATRPVPSVAAVVTPSRIATRATQAASPPRPQRIADGAAS
jgi:hypothetical protein